MMQTAKTPAPAKNGTGPSCSGVEELNMNVSAATASPASAPRARSRAESFPPAVAALLAARDPWCVHCGSPYDLQNHHRRIRGIGGDSRPHTHCACNGVRLCILCALAETTGQMLPQIVDVVIQDKLEIPPRPGP